MTAALAGSLVVLALIDSTSFGTLLIPLWFLAAPGPVQVGRVLVFLTTVAGAYLMIGLALVTGAGALAAAGDLAESPALAWVQLALGVALFVASFFVGRRGTGPGRAAKWRQRALGSTDGGARARGPGASVGLMTLSLTAVALELPTMLPYLAATGLITAADLGTAQGAAVLTGYCLVMVAPALVLLVARVLARRWVEPALARLARWMERSSGETLAWVVGIIGVLLALNALAQLSEPLWIERVTGG